MSASCCRLAFSCSSSTAQIQHSSACWGAALPAPSPSSPRGVSLQLSTTGCPRWHLPSSCMLHRACRWWHARRTMCGPAAHASATTRSHRGGLAAEQGLTMSCLSASHLHASGQPVNATDLRLNVDVVLFRFSFIDVSMQSLCQCQGTPQKQQQQTQAPPNVPGISAPPALLGLRATPTVVCQVRATATGWLQELGRTGKAPPPRTPGAASSAGGTPTHTRGRTPAHARTADCSRRSAPAPRSPAHMPAAQPRRAFRTAGGTL